MARSINKQQDIHDLLKKLKEIGKQQQKNKAVVQMPLPVTPTKSVKTHIEALFTQNSNIAPQPVLLPNATPCEVPGLPILMQNAISALHEIHNTPFSLAIQAVLGVVNLACQARYDVDSQKYGIRPLSLNLIAIAPSGASKTTVYRDLMVGVDEWMETFRKDEKYEKERYNAAVETYKRERAEYQKQFATNGTGLGLYVPVEPFPLASHRYYTSKGTVNGLIDTLRSQPMLGLFSSEGGEFFNSYSFQSKQGSDPKAIEMAATLTSMWDGNSIGRNTGVEYVELRKRRVCMMFLLQEKTVKQFLNNKTFADQGCTHRMLITNTKLFEKPRMDVSKEADIKELKIRASLRDFHNRIRTIISAPFAVSPDNPYELELPVIRMTKEARELLAEYYNSYIKIQMFEEDKYDGFAQRLHEMPLRIAATLAVFDQKTQIDVEAMECAIRLFEYYVEQRKKLDMDIEPVNTVLVEIADKVIKWLEKQGTYDKALSKFKSEAPNAYRKSGQEQRQKILAEMESTGKVVVYSDNGIAKIRLV